MQQLGRPGPGLLARPRQTALQSNRPLGSAEVTHPFHPLRGQRFVVLKVRRVAGVESLSLRHAELGSFAMPREWTDWGSPDTQAAASAEPLYFDGFALLALAELVVSVSRRHCKVDQ
ncbi:Y4bD/Y4pK family protein [Bradyrhizobium nanningense]|uniref:Y4bD/Y4pK family protein n=1 Tax=Bradyrhizobium nanningense TaxID=1325118 RepID=UPI0032216C18